ncbi:hypothetical protein MBM_06456 [Drepanopeziza brunnea f. sp. 'multigermtubi' MB_m1]|uniref:Uncharacterized protein n=1 Tax=Marssonina brunnea f. sp. multigermtubi (strain MB_m1) TaxID=1072389 RepID=K1WCY9_MARBU|nr:uncharacterized protein MBM_06456 [Drepanopeziza brunnea f. sp. 'multigermtubi' MB_m1]EKD15240.1 hypothetical protein MBM_06456 [Drepanopeziza brunnea f. sp. 'multigermtubi' MB_m1]
MFKKSQDLYAFRIHQLESKTKSRKWFHHTEGLTFQVGNKLAAEQEAKANLESAAKQQRIVDKLWREERDAEYRKGVESRKAERERKRTIRERFAASLIIEDDDSILIPILDSEEIWWMQQPLERQILRPCKKGILRPTLSQLEPFFGNDNLMIITDTTGDLSLKQDIISFLSINIDSDGFNSDSSGDLNDSLRKVGDESNSDENNDRWLDISSDDTILDVSEDEFLTYSKKSAFASDPQSLMPTKTERMKGGPPKRADD